MLRKIDEYRVAWQYVPDPMIPFTMVKTET